MFWLGKKYDLDFKAPNKSGQNFKTGEDMVEMYTQLCKGIHVICIIISYFAASKMQYKTNRQFIYVWQNILLSLLSNHLTRMTGSTRSYLPALEYVRYIQCFEWFSVGLETTLEKTVLQVVGDDLLMSNPKRIERAIHESTCNALLLKVLTYKHGLVFIQILSRVSNATILNYNLDILKII